VPAGRLSAIQAEAAHSLGQPKRVIQHEVCYQISQNEPNIDKWPSQAVQKFFKKMKKKLVTP
jgi:hypothetical protein